MIKEFLDRNSEKQVRIAVIGDPMVDQYYYVDANRVSPEFPIPIMLSTGLTPCVSLPGGAGNVCQQFKHFNVNSKLFSLHGVEEPIKRRLYHGEFPLCRWDIEKPNYGLEDKELKQKADHLFLEVEGSGFRPDVYVFSDYNKGIFNSDQDWMSLAKDSISIVDPKTGPLSKWRGCTIFKPNAKEAFDLSGLKDWRQQCSFFMAKLGCQSVIITHGGKGVVGKVINKEFEYRPRHTIVADSVIGAGDCFIAFLAMTQAHAIDVVEAVEIAFEAGAVYVQRMHNKPITPRELLKHADPINAKIVSPEDLIERDYKLVFTNGCYDVLHAGHLHCLREAKKYGDKLVVAINTDDYIKKVKGSDRPIFSLKNRMEYLANLEIVDFVTSFSEDTPYDIIKKIMPDALVRGKQEGYVVGSDLVPTFIVGELQGLSTTNLIKRIRQ